MKPSLLLVCAVSTAFLHAEELTREQTTELMTAVTKVQEAFDSGDVAAMVKSTHPKVHALIGGEEAFKEMTTEVMASIKKDGIRITDNQYGTPSSIHRSGSDQVCFVPRSNVTHIGERKIRGKGFLIAVRGEGEPWRFFDSAILIENPEMLHTLLPGLPKDIKLPENRMEAVK